MSDIKLNKRYPDSRPEDITDAYMRGFEVGLAMRMDENAELRELVRISIEFCADGMCGIYEGCPLNAADGRCRFDDRARELVIEVDG